MTQERLDSSFYNAQPEQQAWDLATPAPNMLQAPVSLCPACGGPNLSAEPVCASCAFHGVEAPSLF